jgi:hypothetical protein
MSSDENDIFKRIKEIVAYSDKYYAKGRITMEDCRTNKIMTNTI